MRKLSAVFVIAVIAAFTAFCFAACVPNGGGKSERGTVRVGAMNGATMIGLAKLDRDVKDGKITQTYLFDKVSTPDAITAGLVGRAYDAAALSVNTAAILFNNKDTDIQVAAVNVLNVLYIVTNGVEISSFADLNTQKETVHCTGARAVPEYVFRYLAEKNGFNGDKAQFYAEPTEIIAGLTKGTVKIAVLPQPAAAQAIKAAAAQGRDVQIRLDLAAEWKKTEGNADKEIITGVLVVRKAYLTNNKETFDTFLKDYKASVEFMRDPANIDEAAQYAVDLKIISDLAVAKEALPLCGLMYMDGETMKDKVSAFLQILYGQNKDFVGGKMPTEEFYYI